MIYVMPDLHGQYEMYCRMLEKIEFTADDTLYLLGDLCDRGPDSAKLYLDVMSRKNVFSIKGNHELMAEQGLNFLLREVRAKEYDPNQLAYYTELNQWLKNGAATTLKSLFDCTQYERRQILRFIEDLPYYRTVTVGDRQFVLVHAALPDFRADKPLNEYDTYKMVWDRDDFDLKLWDDPNKKLLIGHTPLVIYYPSYAQVKIYHGEGSIIAMDCGAAYLENRGRLACLCLDTMKEFYID